MKKLLAIMIIFLAWLPLTAFSSVSSGAIVSGTKVQEIITISFDETSAKTAGTPIATLEEQVTHIANSIKQKLATKISLTIATDLSLSELEKATYLHNISVETYLSNEDINKKKFSLAITYNSQTFWKYFCQYSINAQNVTEIEKVFTRTQQIEMPMFISSFEFGGERKSLVDVVYEDMSTVLNLETEFDYSYVTSTKRLHSNANKIEYDSSSGLTYHTFSFEMGQEQTITLWQTVAKSYVWYLVALGMTGVFAGIMFLVSKRKQKTQPTAEKIIEE